MKKNGLRAAPVALALLLAAGLALGGCQKQVAEPDPSVTPPSQTDGANTDAPADNAPTLTQKDAKSLVDEKLPEGYTSKYAGEIESDQYAAGRKYMVFAVSDPTGGKVGTVAIDLSSGDRYSYTDDGKLGDYSGFPLYNAATDAIMDWNGVFRSGETSVELMQGDTSSFEFQFSDDTAGVARIQGNTASYNDGELTFAYGADGTLTIGGKIAELAGVYTPDTGS